MNISRWFTCVVVALIGTGSAAAAGQPQTSGAGVSQRPLIFNEVLLYSQLDAPGAQATNSQNFEAANDSFDNETADDFVVPVGGWAIDNVSVSGLYFNGPGPAPNVRVTFYNNAGTLPGAAIAACTYPSIVPGGVGASFSLTLAPPCALAPGTYWVGVVANMDFTPGGQWGWGDRTTTSNSPAAWRNPGGGFGIPGCLSFGARGATCGIDAAAPDQLFSLSGVTTPVELMNFNVE